VSGKVDPDCHAELVSRFMILAEKARRAGIVVSTNRFKLLLRAQRTNTLLAERDTIGELEAALANELLASRLVAHQLRKGAKP
jgi:topoisomerase IA-like protein